MTVLVTGATGSIGREVVQALRDQGSAFRALVRTPQRVRALPDGVDAVVADLADPAAVAAALDGVRAALYVSPHDSAEEQLAATFARECERRGVRLVFAGVYAHASNAFTRWCLRRVFGVVMPHYRGKVRIGERLARVPGSVMFGLPNYFQNDEVIRADILDGHYTLPTHPAGLNRIDLRDVGELVARALTDASFPTGRYGADHRRAGGPALERGARPTGALRGRPSRLAGTAGPPPERPETGGFPEVVPGARPEGIAVGGTRHRSDHPPARPPPAALRDVRPRHGSPVDGGGRRVPAASWVG
jgi:uncharacterized protein YbjT (DUF2867 family)